MTSFVWAIILLLLAAAGVVVRKTYYFLPAHELKRRAEKHEQLPARLYPAVSYGGSLRALLWIFIALTSAGGFVLLARSLPVWLSLLVVIGLLWAVYSWLPASRVTPIGARVTYMITPAIIWLLNYLHPLLSRGSALASKPYTAAAHTGLFERDDILKLVEQQQKQVDNRLSDEELEIVKRALNFSDHTVLDVLTPRKAIKTVLAGDAVGPVLIDELHKADQDYVLVRESAKGPFVGTLAFRSLNLQSNGHVRGLMDDTVYYLHENDALSEALHAFFVTNHPLFIVVNSFEEYVGIVTIENILRQLLGHVPGDDFDQYADLAAVAARHPKQKKPAKSEKSPQKPDEKPEK